MNTDTDLRETLRSHERLAPDPAPVATRVRAGIRTRRRRRTAGAVTAVAAAATAVAIALPSVLFADGAGRTTAAAPRPATPAAPGGTAPGGTAAVPRFEPLALPFTVGWLPAGWDPRGMLDSRVGQALHRYERLAGDGELAVQLWSPKLSGRPATDSPSAGTVLRRDLGGDRWLAVSGTLPTAVLERILRSVDVGAPERITFPFRLGWVPAGYRAAESGRGVHHWYGNAAGDNVRADPPLLDGGVGLDTRRDPADGAALWVGVSTEDGSSEAKGLRPNGTLLGRPSRYTQEDGLANLNVYGLRGMHILLSAVTAGRPELTRATLERMVQSLQLVEHPDRPADWVTRPTP